MPANRLRVNHHDFMALHLMWIKWEGYKCGIWSHTVVRLAGIDII